MIFDTIHTVFADCCSSKTAVGRKCTYDNSCGHCKYAYRLVKYSGSAFTAFVDPNGKYPTPSSPGWDAVNGAARMNTGSCPSCGHTQSEHTCDSLGNTNPDYQNMTKALTSYPG